MRLIYNHSELDLIYSSNQPGLLDEKLEEGIETPEFRRKILESSSDARFLHHGLHLDLLSLLTGSVGNQTRALTFPCVHLLMIFILKRREYN